MKRTLALLFVLVMVSSSMLGSAVACDDCNLSYVAKVGWVLAPFPIGDMYRAPLWAVKGTVPELRIHGGLPTDAAHSAITTRVGYVGLTETLSGDHILIVRINVTNAYYTSAPTRYLINMGFNTWGGLTLGSITLGTNGKGSAIFGMKLQGNIKQLHFYIMPYHEYGGTYADDPVLYRSDIIFLPLRVNSIVKPQVFTYSSNGVTLPYTYDSIVEFAFIGFTPNALAIMSIHLPDVGALLSKGIRLDKNGAGDAGTGAKLGKNLPAYDGMGFIEIRDSKGLYARLYIYIHLENGATSE